jgi:hypothetical protein
VAIKSPERRLVLWRAADGSKGHIVTIFRVQEQAKKESSMTHAASTGVFLDLLIDPEDGGDMVPRNAG